MTRQQGASIRTISVFAGLLLLSSLAAPAQPTPGATAAFNSYTRAVEARLAQQHRSTETFLATAGPGATRARLLEGDPVIEKLTPPPDLSLPGAMLHHWRGTAFVPGATAAGFEQLLRDIHAYPRRFSPQVIAASVSAERPDGLEACLRVRQHHVITVVLDGTYDIAFGRLDPQHGYSLSRSRRIAEVDAAGTPGEQTLSSGEEHGFLWRLNTYWSYEQRDGGLYLQIEAVSLTRSIPQGLGWAVRPYVESVPRESLEFTLRSAANALRQQTAARPQTSEERR